MTYDSWRKCVVLFGGWTAAGVPFGDTWVRYGNAAGWGLVDSDLDPQARVNMQLTFDDHRGSVVLHGGRASGGTILGDTWELAFTGRCFGSEPGPTMAYPRIVHSATKLQDGTVLIVGGDDDTAPISHAEVYDPETGLLTTVGPLNTALVTHTATLLDDGRVLIAGGYTSGGSVLDTAMIYDPVARTFSVLSSRMTDVRRSHTATRLANGMVLIVGGVRAGRRGFNTSCDLFDPATDTFTKVGDLTYARHAHNAVLLADGLSVLVVGGVYGSTCRYRAEIFEYGSGIRLAGTLPEARRWPEAGLLPDGCVLVLGGGPGGSAPAHVSTLFRDPLTEQFTAGPDMFVGRLAPSLITLPDDRIVVLGGGTPDGTFEAWDTSEIYDPVTGEFEWGPTMVDARLQPRSVLLDDGRIFTSGGRSYRTMGVPSTTFVPDTTELMCLAANAAPTADAGEGQALEATGPNGADVALDGSGSIDPDGDDLEYEWFVDGEVLATGESPIVTLDLGTYEITLVVSDGAATDEDTVTIVVEDTTPPDLAAPDAVYHQCQGAGGPTPELGEPIVFDLYDPAPGVSNDAPETWSLGTTIVTWTATDSEGNSASDEQIVVVYDDTAPLLTAPDDITEELESPDGNEVDLGEPVIDESCDPDPVVANDAPGGGGSSFDSGSIGDQAGKSEGGTKPAGKDQPNGPQGGLDGAFGK